MINGGEELQKTILIVDDQEINRDLLSTILSTDYKVLTATNGQEALDILRQGDTKVSAITLDLLMPVMDGITFLKTMNKDPSLASIPVMAVTGVDDAKTEQECLDQGVVDFIRKPFNQAHVRQRLKNILTLCQETGHRAVVESVINNLPGGVAVFEIGDTVRTLFVSKWMADAHNMTQESYLQQYAENSIALVHPQERQAVQEAFLQAAKGHQPIDLHYRAMRGGKYVATHARAGFAYESGDKKVYYALLSDENN